MVQLNTLDSVSNRDIVQSDALKVALANKRCGLGISMGVGKTRIAIEHLYSNYNPLICALVVVPKLSIRDSWIDELISAQNIVIIRSHYIHYISIT